MHYLWLLFDYYREEDTLLYEGFLIISYKSRLFLQRVSGYLPFSPLVLSGSPYLYALVTSCPCMLRKRALAPLWETALCSPVFYEDRKVIHSLRVWFILLCSSTLKIPVASLWRRWYFPRVTIWHWRCIFYWWTHEVQELKQKLGECSEDLDFQA